MSTKKRKIRSIIFCIALLTLIFDVFPSQNLANAQSTATVTLNPSTITATALNEVFTVDITVSNVQNLWGWSFNYTWDSRILTLVSVTEGDFLSDRVDATAFLPVPPTDFGFDQRDPNAQNLIGMKFQRVSCSGASSSDGMQQSASGSGVLSTITFKVIKQIQSTPITLYVEQLLGPIEDDRTAGSPHPIITPSSPTSTALVSLIIPGPPTANAGREQTVNAGTPVTFNASQSISTGNGTSYEWTFTDGAMQNLTGQVINYTFDTPGNYTVTLTVSDSLGTDASTTVIHVLGSAVTPTPQITPNPTSDDNLDATPTNAANPTQSNNQLPVTWSVPPTIMGIVVVLTIFVFGGAFFWLKKQP